MRLRVMLGFLLEAHSVPLAAIDRTGVLGTYITSIYETARTSYERRVTNTGLSKSSTERRKDRHLKNTKLNLFVASAVSALVDGQAAGQEFARSVGFVLVGQ
jgi:hypothetical protein